MADAKLYSEHVEGVTSADVFEPEWKFAHRIPGGYAPSRCIKARGKKMMYAILGLAGCAIMFFGYDASVMSLVNTNEDYLRTVGLAAKSDRDAAAVGGLVSLWFVGFALGALMVGGYADRIGRLKTIQMGCLWGALGAALQASAQNFSWMALARIVGGVGCGHLNTVVPIWTSELADHNLRGVFVAVEFTLAISGSTVVYWMEYGCLKTQSLSFAWRFPLAFQIVFLAIILIAIPFFPESPRHLAKTGRIDAARAVLEQCRLNPDPFLISQEMSEIQRAIRLEAESPCNTFKGMLFNKDELHTRRRIILGAGVQIMQKLTGIDFIATYAPEMFTLAGYSSDKANLLAGGNLIGYTVSLVVAIFLIERVGRRKLMMIGSALMGVVLIAGGVLAHEVVLNSGVDERKTGQLGAGVAAVLYIYTFIYGSTWLTTCWVYPTEVFPLASRAKGVALATVAFSVAGGTINEIVPYLISAVGFWVFILFALINLVMLIPIYLFYIETANRHLEDLDQLFASKSNFAWRAEREYEEFKSKDSAAESLSGV